jgi:hypothetical protein
MGMPRRESDLVTWMQVFAAGIAASPGRYQMSLPDSATIDSAVSAYAAAVAAANNPATRNVGTVDAKAAQRSNAAGVCGLFYGLIQRNAGISNESKLLIGVSPINTTRTPRPVANTSPALTVVASTPGAQTVQFRDSTDLTRKAKPRGARALQLYVVVAADNAATPDEARFVGSFTVNPMAITFNSADRGKQATYFARWGGKQNTYGQWSLPVSMTIAA